MPAHHPTFNHKRKKRVLKKHNKHHSNRKVRHHPKHPTKKLSAKHQSPPVIAPIVLNEEPPATREEPSAPVNSNEESSTPVNNSEESSITEDALTEDSPENLVEEEIESNTITDEDNDEEDQSSYSTMVSADSFTPSAAAFSALQDGGSGIKTLPNDTHASRITQVVAPIISIFGGIALVAAAVFYVARKRKRNSIQAIPKKENQDKESLQDIPLNDEEQKTESVYYNSLDYCYSMMSDTLIESHLTTRSNSVNTSKKRVASCRTSYGSSIYTDALVSPTSTMLGTHPISSFLMVAERQQLQHERPSVFVRSTPPETYKAQLMDDLIHDDDDDTVISATTIKPSTLPFYPVLDLDQLY